MCAKPAHNWQLQEQFCKKMFATIRDNMARDLAIKGRRYWILSEPDAAGWKASVVEVREDGSSQQLGIDANGETCSAADDAAERKLRRLLQAY